MSQQPNDDAVEGEIVDDRKRSELAVRPETGMRPIDLNEFRAWADSRAEALQILMRMGIAQTRAEDWSDQGGRPYPEQGACSAMVNMVGVTITPPARRRENFEDEAGRYYVYILESDVEVPRFGIGPLPIVGRASSRDPFFAYRTEEQEDGTREKILRPDSEIDPGDILSKAYTNLRYRAVKAVVPQVANITWEELKDLTGGRVERGKVKQVTYGQGEAPKCPAHGTPMRAGKKGGWYCPRKVGNDFCNERMTAQEAAAQVEVASGGDTPSPDANASHSDPGDSQHPDPRAVAVMDVLRSQGKETKGQQMAALAKVTQALGLGLPTGGNPEVWLSEQSDDDIAKIMRVLGGEEA